MFYSYMYTSHSLRECVPLAVPVHCCSLAIEWVHLLPCNSRVLHNDIDQSFIVASNIHFLVFPFSVGSQYIFIHT